MIDFFLISIQLRMRLISAVGLSMAGTAAGMLILPQLIRLLLEAYEFSGAILVISGLALHAAFGSTLLQPVKW